jgi:OmpA-OmpF porin, OOP family
MTALLSLTNKRTDMKRVILGGLLGAAALAASNALASDDAGAWYLSPMAQYTVLDGGRHAMDGIGYAVALGVNFERDWAAELNASIGSFKIANSGASQQLNAYSYDVLYKFLRNSPFRPYLVAGVGGMRDRIAGGLEDEFSFLAEGGGGVLVGLGPESRSTRFGLRAEAKYRIEFLRGTAYSPRQAGDLVASAGFFVLFGAPVPVPADVVIAPPLPPPPPPPPPPQPPPPPPPVAPVKSEIKLPRVHFETDSAKLLPDSTESLDSAVGILKKNPELVIEVVGHTDSSGSQQHNLGLSQRRAESVLQYLKEHGVTNKMTARGYGENEPIADNKTAEGRAANRRVGLHIVGGPPTG